MSPIESKDGKIKIEVLDTRMEVIPENGWQWLQIDFYLHMTIPNQASTTKFRSHLRSKGIRTIIERTVWHLSKKWTSLYQDEVMNVIPEKELQTLGKLLKRGHAASRSHPLYRHIASVFLKNKTALKKIQIISRPLKMYLFTGIQ